MSEANINPDPVKKSVSGQGAECVPLRSLEELMSWEAAEMEPELKGAPLRTDNYSWDEDAPRTLVCHDMAGGYLEDRFSGGFEWVSERVPVFYLTHWWYIDTFVYFSHNLVTIPPVGWINAAHKHGTKVLGTFITEWEDGASACAQLFGTSQSVNRAVEKLVTIAETYSFEGWLINIENQIQIEHLPNLHKFVRELTQRMKCRIGEHATVIWYDSVIDSSGRLKWQDELNQLNQQYFMECDGIFLNYCWNEAALKGSVRVAEKCGRMRDVYVGVDVFGRGCLGGGGFNSALPLDLVRKHSLSVAIFAPGWLFETLPKKDFQENCHRFWSSLKSFLHCKKLVLRRPIESGFNPGFSHKDGKDSGYNLSEQEIQPHFCCTEGLAPAISTHSSLRLTFDGSAPPLSFVKIFCCDIQDTNFRVLVSYSLVEGWTKGVGLCIWLSVSEASRRDHKVCLTSEEWREEPGAGVPIQEGVTVVNGGASVTRFGHESLLSARVTVKKFPFLSDGGRKARITGIGLVIRPDFDHRYVDIGISKFAAE